MITPKKIFLKQCGLLLASSLVASLISSPASAAEIIKASNNDALDLASSWVAGVVPGASDIAVFDSSFSSPGTVAFNASIAFGGLKVSGNTQNITLDTAAAGGTPVLTLGASGLDLSNATSGSKLILQSPAITVPAATVSTWTVGSGVTLDFKAGLNISAGTLLRINSSGTILANALSNNLPVILNSTDIGSVITENVLDEFGNPVTDPETGLPITQKRMVASAANPFNPANPQGDGVNLSPTPTNTGGVFLDHRNQFAPDGTTPLQGSTVPSGWFFSGYRFSVPNARTDGVEQWTVNFTNGRTITPGIGVMVTDGVGTDDVVFSGTGWFRIDNTNRLILHQDNPSGDLIFRNSGGINARTAASAHIVKSGRGRVIIENGIGANNGLYIYEGVMQIGAGGLAGSLGTGPVINFGTLDMNRSDAVTLGGIISGTGTLVKNGTGALTLTAANTFTGATTINAGSLVLGGPAVLAGSDIVFNGGAITYGASQTTDISSKDDGIGGVVPRAVTFSSGGGTIDTNGNNVTLSGSIGQGGAGGLTKTGAGVLTLAAANSYLGTTTISGGSLSVTNAVGSATGSGNVNVANGGTLTGSGIVSGVVSVGAGGALSPGNGVGSFTLGGLNVAADGLLNFEFASTSSRDSVVTTINNGLTINGGNVRLYQPGTTNNWVSEEGTYSLISYQGTVQGAGANALTVTNPVAGFGYTFGATGGVLSVTVIRDAILSKWTSLVGGSWATGSNWDNGVPTTGYTAQFTSTLSAPISVTLDGNRTVNGAVFNSPFGYTIAQGTSGTLTFSKPSGNVGVNVDSGTHTISAPVALASSIAVSSQANAGLTFSGVVSGAGGLIKDGPGYVDFTNHNTFSGSINVIAGEIAFSHADSLGSGAITLSGGGLKYNAGNTGDLSTRAITIGADGGSIDTNGNNVTYAAPIGNGGTGKLTKLGAGTLSLAGGNTFSGGIQVSAGVLTLAGAMPVGGSTTIGNATLRISGDDSLGLPASDVIFDPGAGNDARLELIGASVVMGADRAVTLSSGRGVFDTGASDLTISGGIGGAGVLVKAGSGTLTLPVNALSGTNGSTVIDGGTISGVRPAILPSGGQGITFNGGNLNFTANEGYGIGNLSVNGVNSAISGSAGGGVFGIGPITGGTGSLTLGTQNWVTDFTGSWAGFTGTIVLGGPSGTFRFNGNTGSADVTMDLGVRGVSVRSSATVITLGALQGQTGSVLTGSGGGPVQAVVYTVGGKNSSTTFAGAITDGAGSTGLSKVGTGTLTLTGTSTASGPVTVGDGVLRVDGVVGATSVNVSRVDPLVGVLAGTGTVSGATTVDGILRPGASGSPGGQLTFGSLLTLNSTAVTQFDFNGVRFTGINSTADSAVNYGNSTLKINLQGTVYTGSYELFHLTGTAGGVLGAVTVSTATVSDVALTDAGSGVWSGVVEGVSYSFNSSTGFLSISGGATPVPPSVPGALSAIAGNAQVSLTWNASAGASNYRVKRATQSGGPYSIITDTVVTTSYTDTLLANGTTYYYVVDAQNGAGDSGNSAEVSATPAAVTLTGLQNWRQEHFGTTDNTGNAADNADPDGDGIVNLLEYATARDPMASSTPVLALGSAGGSLTVTYTRIADANLTYTVQGVNDLAGTPAWATVATSTGAGNVDGPVTVTDTQAISASARRFLRLTVSYTP